MQFSRKIQLTALIAVFLFAVGWVVFVQSRESRLEVTFFDVGQGDAGLIESPYGQNILIDGGPDNTVLRRLSEELPFWERTVDLMILTHPHNDHLNGLNKVWDRYTVRQVMYSGVRTDDPAFNNWLAQARDNRGKLFLAQAGQSVRLGRDCALQVLYPPDSQTAQKSSLNNSSVVCRLDCLGKRFLFTGDIEKEVETELVRSGAGLTADYLKVAHHGSDTSSQKSFLQAVKPKTAFIPVGRDNDFGFPSRRVELRLQRQNIRVHRADIQGTLKVSVRPGP